METPAVASDARQGLIKLVGALAVAIGLMGCAPGDPALMAQQNMARCQSDLVPEQSVAACSAVIADASVEPAQRATALVRRGVLRAAQGQQTRAIADFGRALRLDANNTDAYAERGSVHQQRGAFDIAVRDYDAALAIDPRHDLATYRRDAALQGRVDQVQQQIAQLTEIITRNPQNFEALNNRCWLRAINDEDMNAALADCNAAVRASPQYAAALDSRGLVHLKRGEFQEALADYETAAALEPGRGHYLYGRGLARERIGMIAEGQADLAAAEIAEPGVTQAFAGYGYIPAVGMTNAASLPAAPATPGKP